MASVGNSGGGKKSTGQFKRQGHTAGIYGNDPNATPQGKAGNEPRELKP